MRQFMGCPAVGWWSGLTVWLCLGAGVGLPAARAAETKELTVFAAASLRDVFTGLAATFEQQHPGVKVRLSFAGSQELRVQIEHGAAADVYASADEKHVAALQAQGLVRSPVSFTRNVLVVVVPKANPAGLRAFADLPAAPHVVLGASEVPVGAYADAVLRAANKPLGADFSRRVLAHVRSRELNVRQVLTKVAMGEADAGIVYRSDAQAALDKVTALPIPEELNVIARYPIAVLTHARAPTLASAWVEAVLAKSGQSALGAAGFLPVEAGRPTEKAK